MKPTKAVLYYVLLLGCVVMALGPFVWLLSTAFKSGDENIFQYPPQWWPQHPTLENFTSLWQQVPMLSYFANSLAVTALTVLLNIVLSVLAAYPLARMRFKGQQAALAFVLMTMMIPFQVMMIPLYWLCLKLGLTDQVAWPSPQLPLNVWLGLSLPFALSGFGIFFVRQGLLSLPKELDESAVLDGCDSLQILWYVLMPLIKPTLATLAVFSFMAVWGEFLWPSIILSKPGYFTLPMGLVYLQGAFSANWRLIAAGTILSTIPTVVFYTVFQRYFVSGTLSGAVKG